MMDGEILELLGDIGRTSVARMSPSVYLSGDSAELRRQEVLGTIRGTILPRRLDFTAADGSVLAIEVNSSRITDVFRCVSGSIPDFETEARKDLTEKLAHLMTDIAAAPGPLELVSKRPDAILEADDVGITYSEVEAACAKIEFPKEPQISVVPTATPEPDTQGLAAQFYEASAKHARGRVLAGSHDATDMRLDGVCDADQPLHPKAKDLSELLRDLDGWQSDGDGTLTPPQLIVMRPSGGQGTGLAVLRDGEQTAIALHDTRKLGAVVNIWKSLRAAE